MTSKARRYFRRMNPLVAGSLGAVTALAAVLALDVVKPDSWTASGMALSAAGAIGMVADGYDYSIPADVAWTDVQGGYHSSGRPDCLPSSGQQEGPVRVTAVQVDAAGYSRRQVVHVACLVSE